MQFNQRLSALAAVLLLSFAALMYWSPPAFGQGAVPTAEQLDIFKNLSPDQQQAILQQLGTNGSGTLGSGLGSSDTNPDGTGSQGVLGQGANRRGAAADLEN